MSLDRIPRDTLAEIDRYVNHRIRPGGFLYAVLTNNLYFACVKADDYRRIVFFDIVSYVEGQLPIPCRGSMEAVEAWLRGE